MKNINFPKEMTVVQYNRLSAGFTNRSGRILLKWSNLICAGLFYLCYPVALAILWVRQDVRLTKVILIPAISFVILSGFRKWFNLDQIGELFVSSIKFRHVPGGLRRT